MSWDPPRCSTRFSLSGMDGGAEAAPDAPSPCLEHTELSPSHSLREPLNLSHPSTEGGCGAESISSFPTAPLAPVDGKIAGEYYFFHPWGNEILLHPICPPTPFYLSHQCVLLCLSFPP